MSTEFYDSGYTAAIKEVIKELETFKAQHLNSLTVGITKEQILNMRIDFIEMMLRLERK
jgi:hypothetical protein